MSGWAFLCVDHQAYAMNPTESSLPDFLKTAPRRPYSWSYGGVRFTECRLLMTCYMKIVTLT